MWNFTGHFKTITHHKKLVLEHCFKVGLFWQGLTHDLSKYMPSEFFMGAKYYLGNKSPNVAEREDKGYSSAWLHHKGRNKHHMEYWIDYDENVGGTIRGMKMPRRYVVEMFCDRVAANKNYKKEAYNDSCPLEYYENGKSHNVIHPDTAKLLEKLLHMLKDKGEEYTFEYIRRKVLRPKDYLWIDRVIMKLVNRN